jgi:hypothetical protein
VGEYKGDSQYMPFGKYKNSGMTVEEIAKADREYLLYIINMCNDMNGELFVRSKHPSLYCEIYNLLK